MPTAARFSLRTTLGLILWLTPFALWAGGSNCDDIGGVMPVEDIDYETQIQPIFDANCSPCHVGGGVSGGLDLDPGVSFGNLVNIPSAQNGALTRVVPGMPENSLLFEKVNCDNPPVGLRMPRGGPPLNLETQALINDWILQGALPMGPRIFDDSFESDM